MPYYFNIYLMKAATRKSLISLVCRYADIRCTALTVTFIVCEHTDGYNLVRDKAHRKPPSAYECMVTLFAWKFFEMPHNVFFFVRHKIQTALREQNNLALLSRCKPAWNRDSEFQAQSRFRPNVLHPIQIGICVIHVLLSSVRLGRICLYVRSTGFSLTRIA